MGMPVILIDGLWPFEKKINPPLIEDFTWSLKKIGPVFQRKSRLRCRRTDDDGRQVITIAHPDPSAYLS